MNDMVEEVNQSGNIVKPGRPYWQKGATTVEGKLKQQFAVGRLVTGEHSKLMRTIRSNCDRCPLRPRQEEVVTDGKRHTITIPGKCSFYRPEQPCIIPIEEHVAKLRIYVDELYGKGWEEIQKMQLLRTIGFVEAANEVESLQAGRPGFYTKEFNEQAIKLVADMVKAKQPAPTTTLNVDMAESMIKQVFNNPQSEKKDDEPNTFIEGATTMVEVKEQPKEEKVDIVLEEVPNNEKV